MFEFQSQSERISIEYIWNVNNISNRQRTSSYNDFNAQFRQLHWTPFLVYQFRTSNSTLSVWRQSSTKKSFWCWKKLEDIEKFWKQSSYFDIVISFTLLKRKWRILIFRTNLIFIFTSTFYRLFLKNTSKLLCLIVCEILQALNCFLEILRLKIIFTDLKFCARNDDECEWNFNTNWVLNWNFAHSFSKWTLRTLSFLSYGGLNDWIVPNDLWGYHMLAN